ncbi:hypothetical protein LNQ81_12855 [Myroides sp. M-43]|uniref:hypothetical protein n=1 Tax=Myroides oncorhynchi TaxID=2893756 RepID=UPI001E2DCA26|nr:hypothetical protein [Myroides oncorhynchi]MCC9043563.1 hypothetical protein [Myroides oncorhynchi]
MSTALNVKVVKANWSIVVIPPSKSKSDPLYDDRLLQILEHAGLSDVVVDIFFIEETREPSHTNQNVNNRSVEFHQNIIKYDKKLIPILKNNIIIFDDVITSGAQYKAVKNILLDINPDYNIRGMFIARTLCD